MKKQCLSEGVLRNQYNERLEEKYYIYITFSHLADTFIQSDVQRRKQSSYEIET